MKDYIFSLANQLQNFSKSLDTSAILINKPWAMIDGDFEIQKLIFKKNHELIMSKNGQAQIGRWEYFPQAKSLLIDRVTDKILCNEAFIFDAVLILKLDGTSDQHFILADENVIPDLNIEFYLKQLIAGNLNVKLISLDDGQIMEVQTGNEFLWIDIYNKVSINSNPVADGLYKIKSQDDIFAIENSQIIHILSEYKYIDQHGQEILIYYDKRFNEYYYVKVNGNFVQNEVIDFSEDKHLIVKNGKFVRFKRKKPWYKIF